jgi:hypothetical protein
MTSYATTVSGVLQLDNNAMLYSMSHRHCKMSLGVTTVQHYNTTVLMIV